MKACIIVFSPSSHTCKVANGIQSELIARGVETLLLDVTGVQEIQNENEILSYLESNVTKHDILFIGAPVYAGHFESNMLKVIKSLPPADEKWGKMAVPFITYGGLHSSIALMEAGKLLLDTGRINVAGLKITCFHTLTTTAEKKINFDKPGINEFATIQECIEKLLKTKNIFDKKDISAQFDYISEDEKRLYISKSQDDWHQAFRNVTIDSEKCDSCCVCIKKCPVTRFRLNDKGVIDTVKDIKCILCAECFHNCPTKAIYFPYINVVSERMKAAGPPELEKPENAYFI